MSESLVSFFSEDTTFVPEDAVALTTWVEQVCLAQGYTITELNIIFCSDEYLLQMNREHLDHDYYTDIITFDLSEEDDTVEADLFISVDRVKDNAEKLNISFTEELHRVVIHGVLHLMDFNDKSEEEKKVMREKEDACLSLLKI